MSFLPLFLSHHRFSLHSSHITEEKSLNRLALEMKAQLDFPLTEKRFGNGQVQCEHCRNLESYWKNGNFVFFMCRLKPISLKKLDDRWVQCSWFMFAKKSPLRRRKEIR
jgi:hypothetical protein